MSYCRFSSGDVYLFPHVQGGICCCSCSLAPKVKSIWTTGGTTAWHKRMKATSPCKTCGGKGCQHCMIQGDTTLRTKRQALKHLLLHRHKGHKVPDYALERLRKEIRTAHRAYLKRKNRRP